MRNDFESNYLAHHGILGMKWGRKNGPPYPLSPGDHSAREKNAGWRKSLKDQRKQLGKAALNYAERKAGEHNSKFMNKLNAKTSATYSIKKEQEYREKERDNPIYNRTRDKRKEEYGPSLDNARSASQSKLAGITLTEGQKTAIKIGATVAVTALAAYGGYKVSKYIKTEAGRRIVDAGNKKAAELMKKAGEFRNMAGSAGNLPGQMHRHMLFTQKAVNTENQAAKLLKDTVDMANKTSKSVVDSAKYLHNNPKPTSTPTLTFGKSTYKFTQADQDRLKEISNNLLREAQKRNGIATGETTSFDYAKELIKKNKKTLSGYTMQDLKDLDLY